VALAAVAVLGTSVGAAAAASSGLSAFLLRGGEQPRFVIVNKRIVARTAKQFIAQSGETGQQATRDIAALKQAGFVRSVNEPLGGPRGQGGFSLVVEMKNAKGAAALARTLAVRAGVQGQGTYHKLKVAGVPSAAGWGFIAPGRKFSIANIYWTSGRCVLGSGDYNPSGRAPAPPVIAGVKAQHHRFVSCP
jgi:hypothetical protein